MSSTLDDDFVADLAGCFRQFLQFFSEQSRLLTHDVLQETTNNVTGYDVVQSTWTATGNLMQDEAVFKDVFVIGYEAVEEEVAEVLLTLTAAVTVELN